jgi:hypothetical protein
MNKKNIMLAIASAIIATGLAVSVVGTNNVAFAATSSSSSSNSNPDGASGSTSYADDEIATSAAAAGLDVDCTSGQLQTFVFAVRGSDCDANELQ